MGNVIKMTTKWRWKDYRNLADQFTITIKITEKEEEEKQV